MFKQMPGKLLKMSLDGSFLSSNTNRNQCGFLNIQHKKGIGLKILSMDHTMHRREMQRDQSKMSRRGRSVQQTYFEHLVYAGPCARHL